MQSVLLQEKGLYTFPNHLSNVPQGALLRAKHVIINRDSIIESRRGFKIYGTAAGSSITNIVHQLLTYKGRVLRHYGTTTGTTLEFDSNGTGTFSGFTLTFTGNITNTSPTVTNITTTSQLSSGMAVSGAGIPANTTISSITNNTTIVLSNNATATTVGVSLTFSVTVSEISSGLRLKGIESNGNFYFTTSAGIKKISVASASGLSTAVISNAGGVKALDVEATLNAATGFLTQESAVAYRTVWGIKDANTNLIIGTPSSRVVITNPLTNLLIKNFNSTLSILDTLALSTGIHAQTYVNTYKVALNASASTLRTKLISLASGIDTDIPAFTVTNAAVAGAGPFTITLTVSTDPTNIIQVGDPITLSTFNPSTYNGTATVTAITATTIVYSRSTDPGAYVSGGSAKRTRYASITSPVALSTVPTTDQLLSMQVYYDTIIADLQVEPSGIITTPSVFNSSTSTQSSTVNLKFTIPQGITTAHFYQVYRTALATSSTGISLSLIDPGDECKLAYEANPTATDLSNGYISIQDITPDSFLGANLYTNPNTGETILQANDVPPLAKDLVSFKGYTFYANTQTRQRKQINMLSVSQLVSATSTFTITDGTTTNTYTFVSGVATIQTVTTVADSAGSLNNKYFTINSGKNLTSYYVWYSNGTGVDPAISGSTGIKVTFTNGDTANTIASLTKAKINQNSDFTATVGTNIVTITNTTAGISTAAANGAASPGFSYAVSTPGTGEDATNKKILISSLSTPAQQVDETARSLIRVVNKNASDLVYAYYLSGPTDVPGFILFEARKLGQNQFYFNVNSATTTGTQFDPALPVSGNTVISDNETNPNRIYYSKFQQPEAVPILNTIDVGAKDKQILRILALRDNLFVLKEEGIFRISGLVAPFTTSLFDSSTILKAADSAVVLNNLIYCYASQGVVRVSDTGVEVVSRSIEDKLIPLTTSAFTTFPTATFGVSYESDRSYYLFTVTLSTDTYATQVFRYNTFTNAWTEGDFTKRCGVVNPNDDLLYLGPTDTNYIEQERKNFNRTDFADREISTTIASSSVVGTVITLPSVSNMSIGDVALQTQYLTISQYNQLLAKLDMDSVLHDTNYVSTQSAVAGDALSSKLDTLITKIANDTGRVAATGSTSAATYTALSPTPATFSGMQTTFNSLVTLLINDNGTGTKNYQSSSGTVDYEVIIESVSASADTITTQYAYPFIQGTITIFNHIVCDVIWVPQIMQDVSMTKQASESTLIFEDSSYSAATLSFASDLSPNYEDTNFTGYGNGSFGNSIKGTGIFGGNGSGVPFRTLVPREKQRCRYMNCRFEHAVAREAFAVYGLSLTFNMVSQRGYR